jgi:hypothetical protein
VDYRSYRKRAGERIGKIWRYGKNIGSYLVWIALFGWSTAKSGWRWVAHRTNTDRILAVSTVVIMLATIGGAVSTYLQWVELRSSSAQVDKSIAATNRIGDAAFTANQLNKDAYIANARAWIGPNDASLSNLVADGPVKAAINYANTVRQPAPMNSGITAKVYSNKEWNDGTAARDVENGKSLCLRSPIDASRANVVFPTSGFSAFQLHIDSTPQPGPSRLLPPWTRRRLARCSIIIMAEQESFARPILNS